MKLLVFVLNRPEKLEEILSGFVEIDLAGATIVDSVGMAHVLACDIPIFAGFQDLLKENRPGNKTILSVIRTDREYAEALEIIEDVCGPLRESGAGIVFTIPIDDVHGIAEKTPEP